MYKIINRIGINENIVLKKWNQFACNDHDIQDIGIVFNNYLLNENDVILFTSQSRSLYLKSTNTLLSANDDWSEACISLLEDNDEGLEEAIIAAIMTHLSIRNGIMIHSALIDVNGKGIMFIGPSGIGKTTQAELWMKYRDAIIINGDMALVHEENGSFRGYGCPWGRSPYCENRDVILSAIIVLEQANENSIEKLHGIKLVERAMKNIYLPHWYKPGVEAVMETVDHLLCNVPVYLLKCRPDEEAVALVERTVLKKYD